MNINILGMRVDVTDYAAAAEKISGWARAGEGRYVCVANVHMVMEAYDSAEFRAVVNEADLVVPDGMPLVWCMRLKGVEGQGRVYGPQLTLRVLDRAASEGIAVGLLGGEVEVLEALKARLMERFQGLKVVFTHSPPFRPLSAEEEKCIVEGVRSSGARLLFIGLGCPRQERWMAEHLGRVPAVMLGVGAAFDFLAGHKRQAPRWMQGAGLEWLFRLIQEPRRLWRRYLVQNPRFIALNAAEWLGIIHPR